MRLKEDHSSYHSSAVIRKDYRHSAPEERLQKNGRKKNTRQWCKGVVDRKHVWERQPVGSPFEATVTENVCTHCGKRDYRTRDYNGMSFWDYLEGSRGES